MIRNFSLESFAAESVIVKEGEKGSKFYIIKDGSAKVSANGVDVADLQAGMYFGEMALLEDDVRKV